MKKQNENALADTFYIGPWMAAVPLLVMIVPTIILVFYNVFSANVMIASGVVGIIVGSLFSKKKDEYWDIVIKALGDPTGLMAFALFLIVGIYAEVLTTSNLGDGVIWLSNVLNAGPVVFTLFIYVICSVLGTAMGTSVGVIFILTPILYPVALQLGVPAGLAAGAILSGAATGDHFSPVSDTTLISSLTQRYKFQDKTAKVGEVVRARMKYVIPAFFISCFIYVLVGWFSEPNAMDSLAKNKEQINPKGLVMILPMAVVIWTAVKGSSVFQSITYGILSGLFIALGTQLITLEQVFALKDGKVTGILIDGALANVDTVMMIVLMMGAYGVIRHYGLIEGMITKLGNKFTDTPQKTELTILGLGSLLSFLLIGLVTRLTVIAGPVINELGQKHNIHPNRRANLLDGIANGLSYVFPWHVWPMLMLLTIGPLVEKHEGLLGPSAVDIVVMTFYPIIIWLIMLIAVLTGYGRKFENQ